LYADIRFFFLSSLKSEISEVYSFGRRSLDPCQHADMDLDHFVGKDIFLQLVCFSVGELAGDVVSSAVSNLPSVVYSLLIIVYNSLYLKLARRLTIWENHRYTSDAFSDYERSLRLGTDEERREIEVTARTPVTWYLLSVLLLEMKSKSPSLFVTLKHLLSKQ
jgi:hypothetical protein